jgi:small-conductance mechanosensitive channel
MLAGLLLASVLLSQAAMHCAGAADQPAAKVFHAARYITTFHVPVLGYSPVERAEGAMARIEALADRGGPFAVSMKPAEAGIAIEANGKMVFMVLRGDVNELAGEDLETAAQSAARELGKALDESVEQRSLRRILIAAGLALLATAAAVVGFFAIVRVRRWVSTSLKDTATRNLNRLGHTATAVLHPDYVGRTFVAGAGLMAWLAGSLLVYVYATFVLELFPLTRPLGEGLQGALFALAAKVGGAIVHALPGLALVVVIFFLARLVTQILSAFFQRVERGVISVRWLEADIAAPTRRIAIAVVWLFALAMAYPYLPGAQSDAFKGLSVLVGLMISLGASSTVSQAASGLILMYSRAFRVGEYVRIGDTEGTVMEVSMLVTRIRTGLGEEVMLPNSVVLATTSKNYSRVFGQLRGFVLDTIVTIGYDAPWRQVHEMLLEAARRTSDIVPDPAPYVIQTALSDFYVDYRLVTFARSERAIQRVQTLSELHGHIQDVFNENGVQIMSPHYLADPEAPKIIAEGNSNPPLKRSAPIK